MASSRSSSGDFGFRASAAGFVVASNFEQLLVQVLDLNIRDFTYLRT
jgi:hypothetical protein